MAKDFISINMQAPQAAMLRNYITNLRAAYNAGAQVREMMTHMNDSTDFSAIETMFGVPAGSGQTVFDLVNGSTGAMVGNFQTSDCKTITEKVG